MLLFLQLNALVVLGDCPIAEGFRFVEHLALCYWRNTEEMDWEESRRVCQQKGGDLISLDTEDKFLYMRRAMGNDTRKKT